MFFLYLLSFFIYKIGELEGRTSPARGGGLLGPVEGGGGGERK
jgi:hypothetical protein